MRESYNDLTFVKKKPKMRETQHRSLNSCEKSILVAELVTAKTSEGDVAC